MPNCPNCNQKLSEVNAVNVFYCLNGKCSEYRVYCASYSVMDNPDSFTPLHKI